MRVALTGTPGTGKTTVAGRLDGSLRVLPLREVIDDEGLVTDRDPVRNSDIIDLDGVQAATASMDDVVFESHLSHHLNVDRVVVLRCHPDELTERLRGRGAPERSIAENAESEALDLILSEAVAMHGRDAVYEIDTTDRPVDEVVSAVEAAIAGEVDPTAGIVDFTGWL